MSRTNFPRTNWFDGMEVTESEMDTEQTAWHGGLSTNADIQIGSGVDQEFVTQRVLFDTADLPASITTLIDNQTFDGEPIYPTDTLGLTVYTQPSDTTEGAQLEVELTGATLTGSPTTKVYIFGTKFGGGFVHEVLVFDKNESQITETHFVTIAALMTQDFRGNQNTSTTGTASVNRGGRLRILESKSMSLARDVIMASQAVEPNMDYVGFVPADVADTLDTLLDEIAATISKNKDDLNINVTATTTRKLSANDATGLIVGQKFKATTNNIQKVSVLLGVEEDTTATSGNEFNWSGDLVIGIRALQTTTTCPTDTIPNSAIEFEPEPSAIAEVSFDQGEMAELGITLNATTQVVDFVFTQSSLSNPNVTPTLTVGSYYMLTIRRSGDISVGNIVLQEAANTTPSTSTDEMYMSVFAQNSWTDVPESDLWFKVYTDSIRVTDGTAFDDGVRVTIPRTKLSSSTSTTEPYVEGKHNLIDVARGTKNYVIVQESTEFSDAVSHPSTGNQVFSRITDSPEISILSESSVTTLIDADNEPVILGSVNDANPRSNPQILGTTMFPGLVTEDKFTIIQPSSDIRVNNLEGSILIPNTGKTQLQYRITKVEIFTDAYGDVDNDGDIDAADVTRAQALDGYGKDLTSGGVSSVSQRNAIVGGTVTMDEIIRADVNDDGVVDILDAQAIQQYISLGTAFSAGSNFTRAVLTVENVADPLTTSVDMIGNDSDFNSVPFTPIGYRIDFVPLWKPSNVILTDLRRFVPKTFTQLESSDITGTPPNGGKNTLFVPGDILFDGYMRNPDETYYKIDLEVNHVIIELPEGSTAGEINIFSNYIKDKMFFFDGTAVGSSALDDKQVLVTASVQSVVKDLDGYDYTIGGTNIDETVAVLYTQASGILRVRSSGVRNVTARPEMKTKIVLTVYLKKAGFRNTEVTVDATTFQNLVVNI